MASKDRRRGLNITLPQVLVALGLVFGFAVISSFTQKIEKTRSIKAEGQRLMATATALIVEQEALRVTQVYVESDDFTRREAPPVIKYLPEGGVLVVVVTPPAETQLPGATPTPGDQRLVRENWQVWGEMFFDPKD